MRSIDLLIGVVLLLLSSTVGVTQAPNAAGPGGTFNSNANPPAIGAPSLGIGTPAGVDPVSCFDHAWRHARSALQAYQAVYGPDWREEIACHERAAAPDLEPCWIPLLQARPLIEQAARSYEDARHSGLQPVQQPLAKEGDRLMKQAAALIEQAGTCFTPILAAWSASGGRYPPAGRIESFNSSSSAASSPPPLVAGAQTSEYGIDPVCGDSLQERHNKDQLFGTSGVVLLEEQAIPLIQQGKVITCDGCPRGPLPAKLVCWFGRGENVPTGAPPPPSGGIATTEQQGDGAPPACTTANCGCKEFSQTDSLENGFLHLAQLSPGAILKDLVHKYMNLPLGIRGKILRLLIREFIDPHIPTIPGPLDTIVKKPGCRWVFLKNSPDVLAYLRNEYNKTKIRIDYLKNIRGKGVGRYGGKWTKEDQDELEDVIQYANIILQLEKELQIKYGETYNNLSDMEKLGVLAPGTF
jgi:hypothetical protein